MQAATLETLVNLVAAGYGATLIPALAADSFRQPRDCTAAARGPLVAHDSVGEPAGISASAGIAGAGESDPESGGYCHGAERLIVDVLLLKNGERDSQQIQRTRQKCSIP